MKKEKVTFEWQVIEKVPGAERRERRVLIVVLLHAYSHNTDQSQPCPQSAIVVKQQKKSRGDSSNSFVKQQK